MKSLTWDQVTAWRLMRHGLAPRVGFMEAVRRMIGAQAQVTSAAELSLWARVDGLHPTDAAVVLVDGRISGVWEYKSRKSGTTVSVRMFASPTAGVREAIVAEAERLNDFLDTRVVVEFEGD